MRRLALPLGAALLAAAPAAVAQQPGAIEIGGYGMYTAFDESALARNRTGTGARLGVFVTPALSLEGEGAYVYTDYTGPTGGRQWYSPIAVRAVLHTPMASRATFLVGGGAVRSHFYYADEGYSSGLSGLLGLRLGVTPHVAVRVDGVMDYLPKPRATNFSVRSGISFMGRLPQPGAATAALERFGVGAVEVGTFGQYSALDQGLGGDRATGGGGRLGLFVTPRLAIEGELSSSTADSVGGAGSFRYAPLAVRAVYHRPLAGRVALVVGGGAVRSDYYSLYDFGVSGLGGLRLAITDRIGVRVDGTLDYLVEPGYVNTGLRAGVSLVHRGAIPAAPEPPRPAPEPIRETVVLTTVDSSAIRDSLARARAVRDSIIAFEEDYLRRAVEARMAVEALIYFAFDEETLLPPARAALDAKLPVMRANPAMRILIEGHADERGSDEYNLALGQRRAAAAKRYLVQRGIDGARIETVSWGEERPSVRGTGEGVWSKNRRDEFRILIGAESIVPPPR